MTSSIQFYHLLHTPLDRALPKLLEKVVASGNRAVIRVRDAKEAERLCDALWTYDPASFLPHGTAKDGAPSEQPIFLTPLPDNPNNADILILTDGSMAEDTSAFSKILDMFDGQSDDATASARERFRTYKDAGHTLSYFKQKPEGGWEKAA